MHLFVENSLHFKMFEFFLTKQQIGMGLILQGIVIKQIT